MNYNNRVYNFSAGPSMLPLEVLERAGSEITNANGSGQSIMEMSHRSADFKPIIVEAERRIRALMQVPNNYRILFLQGGGWTQFSMVPLNLGGLSKSGMAETATYIDTGVWASKAAEEASKYLDIQIGASSKDKNYTYIPSAPPPQETDAYYYICLNNTIVGTKWNNLPKTEGVPLVADISSCILSETLDISKFGLVFAGAQKNLGPAGCTIVIIREDLIGAAPHITPAMLNYKTHADECSLFNTPPVWSIYVINLVLEWIEKNGGAEGMKKRNAQKAALLYACLDSAKNFYAPVLKADRSLMNVPFLLKDFDQKQDEKQEKQKIEIEKKFLQEAAREGLVNLAGHRLVGGLRASIYNAMPLEGVQKLCSFIEKFDKSL
ncbi:MAG: 3-phosphoserine/phosphohydroxythreonine transaminase [Termitinemataceae bacterium]|nr:MAG: 3-phosphoserine/phosphohydroxythreonine transaminase [Termitinemataceae bacterium]